MVTALLCLSSTLSVSARATSAFVRHSAAARSGDVRKGKVLLSRSSDLFRFQQRGFLLSPTVLAASTASPGTDKSTIAYDLLNKEKGLDAYTPSSFESEIYAWWEQSGCFQPDAKQDAKTSEANGKKSYVLPMPPPNVTGRLHMGHAIFVALQDVLARFHRMRGRPVLWLPGT
jgi:hypothetical protein